MTTSFRHTATFGPHRHDAEGTLYRPFRYYSADGLLLAGRDHDQAAGSARLPLVCLPGLSRNGRDFEPVARRFAPDRRVVTLDFRGRGESERDHRPGHYTPLIETGDVVGGLEALGIERAIFLGTSRGGIVTMLTAAFRPALIAAAILNDIGPVIERAGLLRIKSYVGIGPAPADWPSAAEAAERIGGGQFPALDKAAWARFARRIYREVAGRPALDYDPTLAHGLAELDDASEIPTLWPPFEALAGRPVLAIRGALSDILTPETLAAMAERLPGLETLEVPGQGHAPLLEDAPSLDRIAAFLARAEAAAGQSAAPAQTAPAPPR